MIKEMYINFFEYNTYLALIIFSYPVFSFRCVKVFVYDKYINDCYGPWESRDILSFQEPHYIYNTEKEQNDDKNVWGILNTYIWHERVDLKD